jgi:hypothetical protein
MLKFKFDCRGNLEREFVKSNDRPLGVGCISLAFPTRQTWIVTETTCSVLQEPRAIRTLRQGRKQCIRSNETITKTHTYLINLVYHKCSIVLCNNQNITITI